jgi:D-3-phosphoglycerate dehydrogenase
MSVNLPDLSLPHAPGTHRVAHLHRNVPGVLATVNGILADHGINVESQGLNTYGELGYLLTDIGLDYAPDVVEALSAMPETVRLRIID